MEHGIDLVLTDSALQAIAIANIPTNHLDAIDCAAPNQLALGYPIPSETAHICSGFEHAARQPTADKTGAASDQGWSVPPNKRSQAQTFHGASPDFHMSL